MKTPHPTLRAVYYVNWTDIAAALALTDCEMEQADTALGQRFTWGDAGLTLADVAIVRDILDHIIDPREAGAMLATFDTATEGAAYINLEAPQYMGPWPDERAVLRGMLP